jgi:hypothetical protein
MGRTKTSGRGGGAVKKKVQMTSGIKGMHEGGDRGKGRRIRLTSRG